MSHNDTIVARATPPGRGGVGILRISGLKARDVAQAVLGKLPKPRYADYLPFKDADGTPLDQGLRCGFRGRTPLPAKMSSNCRATAARSFWICCSNVF